MPLVEIFCAIMLVRQYQNNPFFLLDIALDSNLDVEQLPEAVPSGNFKAVSIPENSTFVAFDLETTDLGLFVCLFDCL